MSRKGENALLLQWLFAFLRGFFGAAIVGFAILGIIWLIL